MTHPSAAANIHRSPDIHRSLAGSTDDPASTGPVDGVQRAAPFPILLGQLLAPDLAVRVGRSGVLKIVRCGQDLPLLEVERPATARYTVACPRTGGVAADLRLPGADPSVAAVVVAAAVLTRLPPQVLDRPGSDPTDPEGPT